MIKIKEIFDKYNLTLSDEQVEMFREYYRQLIEWNEKINLTTITDYDDVIVKHFLDCALLLNYVDESQFENKNVIDVGTGAGFPGLVLAILLPKTKFTLVDSLNKRINFLNEVISKLGLQNVTTRHGRAEDVSRETLYRETYDYAVSRAVANISTLMEYVIPFIKVNGIFLAYKSIKVEEELEQYHNVFDILNCNLIERKKYQIENMERELLFIKKDKPIDGKYPRKSGKPSKNPLK